MLGFDFESHQIGDFSLSLLESFTYERFWEGGTKIPEQARLAFSQTEGRKQTLMKESEEMSHFIDSASKHVYLWSFRRLRTLGYKLDKI